MQKYNVQGSDLFERSDRVPALRHAGHESGSGRRAVVLARLLDELTDTYQHRHVGGSHRRQQTNNKKHTSLERRGNGAHFARATQHTQHLKAPRRAQLTAFKTKPGRRRRRLDQTAFICQNGRFAASYSCSAE